MKTLLLVAHGSPDERSNAEARKLFEETRRVSSNIQVEIAFLEHKAPDILGGIEKCIQKGSHEIKILPLILTRAGHVKKDIPTAVSSALKIYPNVSIDILPRLGFQPCMLDILQSHAKKTLRETAINSGQEGLHVIFMGRGTLTTEANAEVYRIARLFSEHAGFENIHVAFSAVTYPTLEKKLQEVISLKPRSILVIPYLLFEGVLTDRMNKTCKEYASMHTSISFLPAPPLGADPRLARCVMEILKSQGRKD